MEGIYMRPAWPLLGALLVSVSAHAEPDRIMRHTAAGAGPPLPPHHPDRESHFDFFRRFKPTAEPPAAPTSSPTIVVAILDTGITQEKDIAAHLLPGYDFISEAWRARDGDGRDADPTDAGDYEVGECDGHHRAASWHGTAATATLLSAANDAASGRKSPAIKVLPVRVLGLCGGLASDVADAILWSAGLPVEGVPRNQHPARVIAMSLASASAGCSGAVGDAVRRAVAAGVAVVVSAGSSAHNLGDPASCPGAFVVGAVDAGGHRLATSGYGPGVDLSASGVGGVSGERVGRAPAAPAAPAAAAAADSAAASVAEPLAPDASSAATHLVAGTLAAMLGVAPGVKVEEAQGCLRGTAHPFPAGGEGLCTTGDCGAGIVDVEGGMVCAMMTLARTCTWCRQSCFRGSQLVIDPDHVHSFGEVTIGGTFYMHAVLQQPENKDGIFMNFGNGGDPYTPGLDAVMVSLHAGTIYFQVFRSGKPAIAALSCGTPAGNGDLLVEIEVTATDWWNEDGLARMSQNGRVCASGEMYLPATVLRRDTYYDYFHSGMQELHQQVTDFYVITCEHLSQPFEPEVACTPQEVVKFATVSEFNQEAETTFGAMLEMRAAVTINSFSTWARVFDFGTGIGTGVGINNVLLALEGDTKLFVLAVYRHGTKQQLICNKEPPLGTAFNISLSIVHTGPNNWAHYGVEGIAYIYLDDLECARGRVHLPEMVVRKKNYIGRSTWVDPDLNGKVENFRFAACVPNVPCSAPTQVVSFHSPNTFDETRELTFGGPLYMRASVYIEFVTPWARVFDFGNGEAQDNIVLSLNGDRPFLALDTYHGSDLKRVTCSGLHTLVQTWLTVEVTIARGGPSGEATGTVSVHGIVCGTGPVHLPRAVVRKNNYIGHSNWVADQPLHGNVEDFLLSVCP